jgi:hypothetical protein
VSTVPPDNLRLIDEILPGRRKHLVIDLHIIGRNELKVTPVLSEGAELFMTGSYSCVLDA